MIFQPCYTLMVLILLSVIHVQGGRVFEVAEETLPVVFKQRKCVFLYAFRDNCDRCKQLYHTFLIAAQNFRNDKEIFFGTVSDERLVQAFEVTSFPGIIYYEYDSVVPKVYLGDITSGAISKVASDAMRRDFRKLDRQYSLVLNKDNFDDVIDTDKQYRLIMLHEADDGDDVDLYEDIAETFENEPDVIIARINVDFEKKLKRKYYAIDYPSFYWYPKGSSSKKKRYGGELNVGQMITFINKEAGLFRTKGGRLNPYAGLIKPLDQVINKYGKDLHEIRNFFAIRHELRKAAAKLSADTSEELVEFYFEILDEIEEDRTIESLDETRNRLYRRMDEVGPLEFDQLIRKRNIVQKFIDIIGNHLLQQLSDGDFGEPLAIDENYGFDPNEHGIEFHDEL